MDLFDSSVNIHKKFAIIVKESGVVEKKKLSFIERKIFNTVKSYQNYLNWKVLHFETVITIKKLSEVKVKAKFH